MDSQLQMLTRLLARRAERPVILAGHSMGGVLTMMHALRAPQTVEGLVLLDPPVPNVTRWARDPRLTATLVLLRLPGVAALVARQAARITPEQQPQGRHGDPRELVAPLRRTGEERDHVEDGAELGPRGGSTSVVACGRRRLLHRGIDGRRRDLIGMRGSVGQLSGYQASAR